MSLWQPIYTQYHFTKTFNCNNTKWYFNILWVIVDITFFVEIVLCSIRPYLDYNKHISNLSGLMIWKSDTFWKFLYACSSLNKHIQIIEDILLLNDFKNIRFVDIFILHCLIRQNIDISRLLSPHLL